MRSRFAGRTGVVCPFCAGREHSFLSTRKTWQCKSCAKQFSVKKGTIFEDSPIKLDKWLTAMWLISSAKNGISSYELHRGIGVTQKTAWFMLHRLRLAMQNGSLEKLADNVEADETSIGRKARNMHRHIREAKIKGTGASGKTIVMGMLERGGPVIAKVIPQPRRSVLHPIIKANVLSGTRIYTDALSSYDGLGQWYVHQVIDHALSYAQGAVHTNGMENFWSLLKRTLNGTYISVEPFHLHSFLDEQSFRFNERRLTDGERFEIVAGQIAGKRLTYAKLTGKECLRTAM